MITTAFIVGLVWVERRNRGGGAPDRLTQHHNWTGVASMLS